MINEIKEELDTAVADSDAQGGTNGDDALKSTEDNGIVVGKGGDDTITGNSGDNILVGNTGDDIIAGGAGDDIIQGGVGADVLKGAAGNDVIVATTDDALIAGGNGFDVVFMKSDGGEDTFNLASNSRGVEALVAYGDEDVYANVSLSSILGQSQDDGDAETPDTDNTFIALGLEGLTLQSIRKFVDEEGELEFSAVDLDDATEDAYLEMLGLSFLPDNVTELQAYTFGSGEDAVTIITELSADEIFVGGESLADIAV